MVNKKYSTFNIQNPSHIALYTLLYGLLRPLDLIMPYRLKFATKLKAVRYKDILFDSEVIHSVRSYQKTGSGFLPASTEKVLL